MSVQDEYVAAAVAVMKLAKTDHDLVEWWKGEKQNREILQLKPGHVARPRTLQRTEIIPQHTERTDMKISEEFPSQYLKASDLGGREIRVTMGRVERETIGTDKKLVLYFKGKEKGLVLNKTNANTVGDGYGDDTDEWFDQPLILFSVKTDYQGKVVDAIRCRVPTAKDNREAQPRREDPISTGPQRKTGGISDTELNDEVPF